MGTVYLHSLSQLGPTIRMLGVETERRLIKGLRESARFGHTAVVRTTKRTADPFKIRASGSYENNWIKQDIPQGALVANAIFYAVFVERGRKKGKAPPFDSLMEWVHQKRINVLQGPHVKGRGAKAGRARRHAAQRVADIAFGRAVQRKIAKKGTKGRFVLKRTMPMITKFAAREIRRQLRLLAKNPPSA